MKKLLAIILAIVMVLSLCACGTGESNDGSNKGDNNNNQNPNAPTEELDDRVELDVFAGVTVKFSSAINGLGKNFEVEYDYTKIDYDKSNTDIKAFLKGIEFSHDNYENLSNGDEIVVNASWSKSTADDLGLKLKEESKTFTVEGMYDVYRSANDLPGKLEEIDGILDALDEETARSYLVDQAKVSHRYYYAYRNDNAGKPYISSIFITAVLKFEDFTATFLAYTALYQEYWEMNMTPTVEESTSMSETGELFLSSEFVSSGFVKLEEFFPS